MANNRRHFIRTAAVGTAGLMLGGSKLSAKSYNRIIGANERIQVAIAGLGRRVNAIYTPVSLKRNNVDLVYLCDVMASQREKAAGVVAEMMGVKPKLENDIRKVLADKKVDALFNLTPDHWHAPGTMMALAEGKHVYVDRDKYILYDRDGKVVRERISKTKEGGLALGGGGGMSTLHVGNFFNAIRGKETLQAPIDDASISMAMVHYGNVAYRINRGFDINPQTGKMLNKKAMKLWGRKYAKGWEPKL